MEEQVNFCWLCKRRVEGSICPECGNPENVKSYEYLVLLHSLARHAELPGIPLLPIKEVIDVRDGPVEAAAAVGRFRSLDYHPDKTLVFFYPAGLNSLNFEIVLCLKDLGYPVVVWYWDSKTKTYF